MRRRMRRSGCRKWQERPSRMPFTKNFLKKAGKWHGKGGAQRHKRFGEKISAKWVSLYQSANNLQQIKEGEKSQQTRITSSKLAAQGCFLLDNDVLHRVEEINLEAGEKKREASENRDMKERERTEKLHAVATKYVSNPSGPFNTDELKLMLSGAKDKSDSPIKTRKGDLMSQLDRRVGKVTSMIRTKFPDLAAQLASTTNSTIAAADGFIASSTVASA